ncbi:YitT family protein [[Clostridium] innocuum]|nr:YitT family protein [[Clostridium] innocuum]MCR0576933.1 YitT family protein [[Clostridium] innocuum]
MQRLSSSFKQYRTDVLLILAGNFMIACAVVFFVLPNNILTGGVAGISVALQPITHMDTVLMINLLTIGLFVLGTVLLGRKFALQTIISAIVSPLFITVLSILVSVFGKDSFRMNELLASIYTGVFMGIGLGIVFRAHASTGGMDIPALLLAKYCHLPSGSSVMIVDGCSVLLGILTYGFAPALTGIVSVFLCGKTINQVIKIKTQPALEIEIISDRNTQIQEYILQTIDRGATIVEGYGAYTNTLRSILLCVVSQKQYTELETKIQAIDPQAFLIVKDVYRVRGEGFFD